MDNTWLKLCGGVLLLTVSVLLLRQTKAETWPLRWVGILFCAAACLSLFQPVLSWLKELSLSCGIGEYTDILFRAFGISAITQICADLCRHSGEGALATGVELAGKTELLLLALPLLRRLLADANDLLTAL